MRKIEGGTYTLPLTVENTSSALLLCQIKKGTTEPELIIQIDKNRSFFEYLPFRNKMDKSDELLKLVHQLVKKIEGVTKMEIIKVA